jgi:hypothetical protein
MNQTTAFAPGDRVRHAQRPEWGVGTVDVAQMVIHHGKAAQRLVISFGHRGRVTVNTAVAHIEAAEPAESKSAQQPQTQSSTTSDLPPLVQRNPAEQLLELPEAATDPLSTPIHRLRATLRLCRFTEDARSMIDWAIGQTGLNDPLSRFERHDLESHYRGFLARRDAHVIDLVRQIRRANQADRLEALCDELAPALRNALRRAMSRA